VPYKDKDKAREYQRNYQRKRRAMANNKLNKVGYSDQGITQQLRLETLEDLRAVLERIMAEALYDESLDLGVKGRIISQLLTVGIRLIESTDLEHRIEALESRAEMSKYA